MDLFFVISGFIMATIPKPSAGRFLFDRFWRIFPLWWIAVLPFLLMASNLGWRTLLSSVTLWPIYAHFTPQALTVGWTLSFELLFYAAVALASRSRPAIPLAIFGAALVAGITTGWPLFRFIGNPIIIEFLMGVAIARLPRDERLGMLLVPGIAALCVAPLAMYGADVAVEPNVSWLRVLFWGVPAALIFCAAINLERIFANRLFDVPVLIGNASYSIYLFHLLVLRILPSEPWLAFVSAIVFGIAIYRFVERPIIKLKPKLKPPARTDTGAAPEATPAIRIST